jgi:hypothetical protein
MQSFKLVAILLLGFFWLVGEEGEEEGGGFVENKASLASAEVSAGAVAINITANLTKSNQLYVTSHPAVFVDF